MIEKCIPTKKCFLLKKRPVGLKCLLLASLAIEIFEVDLFSRPHHPERTKSPIFRGNGIHTDFQIILFST